MASLNIRTHSDSHSLSTLSTWDRLVEDTTLGANKVVLDGDSLDIKTVVGVARHSISICLDQERGHIIESGAKKIIGSLDEGKVIYGVNTGVGGSANTRTNRVDEFQQTIIHELQSGILSGSGAKLDQDLKNSGKFGATVQTLSSQKLSLNDDTSTYMPESWVRASILIRINSLAKGNSGVRLVLIQRLTDLLSNRIIPLIPLRGSISASGDLMPLSYIGSALVGSSTTLVWNKNGQVITSDIALKEASLDPIVLGPKEGLAIVNGTSVSAGVATLVLYDANCLAVLAQVLTAMSTEALNGSDESFLSFFSKVRPHSGQRESSYNIYNFLTGSKLKQLKDGLKEGTLPQDRYAIRTASQWIGPVLEDFQLATRQLTIECNSATDNPLLDISSDSKQLLSGGNFQAKAVTSAMEKVRLGLQSLGQMLFAQCTEVINPSLSNGLPPNLVATEPSQSFLMKPLDVMMASLQSELGFLANPVGSHVLSAEMGNQSLNSLALISARYSHVAVEVLSQISAAHLLALCQAFDLRAMQIKFLEALKPQFWHLTTKLVKTLNVPGKIDDLCTILWLRMIDHLDNTVSVDSFNRFDLVFKALQPAVLESIGNSSTDMIPALKEWTANCSNKALQTFQEIRLSYAANPDAAPFLGNASRRMYRFVRGQLEIPFIYEHRKSAPHSTTGSLITRIYEAIRSGDMFMPVMDSLREVLHNDDVDLDIKCKL